MVHMMLICPECGEEVKVPLSELVVGRNLRCEHCNADLLVDHARESLDQPAVWQLLNNIPEEEERRA